MKPNVTIQQVKQLQAPTQNFYCPLDANIYGIQFTYFKIRNILQNVHNGQKQQMLFQIRKDPNDYGKQLVQQNRTVKYHFGPLFFHLNTIGTTLQFKIGDKPVKQFLMIERHYFKNKLIKSYQFMVPFCIPNTTNSLQAVYDLPQFTEQEKQQMIQSPWETKSDSFYFVQGKLVMHNKAQYNYASF